MPVKEIDLILNYMLAMDYEKGCENSKKKVLEWSNCVRRQN